MGSIPIRRKNKRLNAHSSVEIELEATNLGAGVRVPLGVKKGKQSAMELYRICDGKNKHNQKHRFSAEESFRERTDCPICGRPMDLIEVHSKEKSVRGSGTRKDKPYESFGLMRGKKIDILPRIAWFSDAVDMNEEDQEKAGEVWSLSDAKTLAGLYMMAGDSSASIWKKLSEDIGRSLFAVERQLRIIKYCPNELEKYYPKLGMKTEELDEN